MAKCKRCGASFDYEKREGVCPKCCFYNRRDNQWQDDSWLSAYGDAGAYQPPKTNVEYDEVERKRHGRKATECTEEGSHVHTKKGTRKPLDHVEGSHSHEGGVVRRETYHTEGSHSHKTAKKASPIGIIRTVVFLIILFNVIVTFGMSMLGFLFE